MVRRYCRAAPISLLALRRFGVHPVVWVPSRGDLSIPLVAAFPHEAPESDDSFAAAEIEKRQLYITNVVHCHPPGNVASRREWKTNCTPYLYEELEIVRPKLIIGLGKDAEVPGRKYNPSAAILSWPFRTPRNFASQESPRVHFVNHPSWVKRQHDDALTKTWVASLARAVRWGFALEPTCKGMVPQPLSVAPKENS